jgi:hypothetical protein
MMAKDGSDIEAEARGQAKIQSLRKRFPMQLGVCCSNSPDFPHGCSFARFSDLDALLAVMDSDSLKENTRKGFEKGSLIVGIYPIKEARLKLPLCTPLSHHHKVAGDQRHPKAIPPRPRQDKGQAESTARFAIDRPHHRESRQAEQALEGAASSCVISVHPQVMETMSGIDKEGPLRSLDTSN